MKSHRIFAALALAALVPGVPAAAQMAQPAIEVAPGNTLLTVTALGFGKRTPLPEYRVQGRNGKGIIAHATGPEIGEVAGAREVSRQDQVMLVTDRGRVIRISAGDVRLVKSRSSKGVRLMRLESGERIVDLDLLPQAEQDEDTTREGEE